MLGQLVIAAGSIADFGAIILLSRHGRERYELARGQAKSMGRRASKSDRRRHV